LIVDDHPIVRLGYSQLIAREPDLEVCGVAASQQEALVEMQRSRPNLAIVDISLKDSYGLTLLEDLRAQHATVKVLVISAHDESLFAERALEAGALGYINKHEATDKLVDGIRTVLAGQVFLSDEMTRRLLRNRVGHRHGDSRPPVDALTTRELEVFELVGQGRTTRQIAHTLHLSPKTIERHKENLKDKLNIANATELVRQATRWVLESRA
jgi:DNA-binding NarL/FixJ family response regulator